MDKEMASARTLRSVAVALGAIATCVALFLGWAIYDAKQKSEKSERVVMQVDFAGSVVKLTGCLLPQDRKTSPWTSRRDGPNYVLYNYNFVTDRGFYVAGGNSDRATFTVTTYKGRPLHGYQVDHIRSCLRSSAQSTQMVQTP